METRPTWQEKLQLRCDVPAASCSWEPKGTPDPMPRGNPQKIAGVPYDHENPLVSLKKAGYFLGVLRGIGGVP